MTNSSSTSNSICYKPKLKSINKYNNDIKFPKNCINFTINKII